MALDATCVENGLHEPIEAEGPGAFGSGRQLRGALSECQGHGRCGRCLISGFMAADAGERLIGQDVGQRAHGLEGHAVLVEGLEEDGHAGRDAEEG